jgi:tripartite-type tricarboxylate transporter receptor subunit TctC
MGGARLWALAIAMIASAAYGQDYPVKPITLVNPYAAGGPADLLARTVAAGMSDLVGQQVVILNKPPPKEFADYLQADSARLSKLIKSANIQPE